jgi:hypothetical protein
MKRLAGLVIAAALALPCMASDSVSGRGEKRKTIDAARLPPRRTPIVPAAPARLLDAELLRTILFPDRAFARWVTERLRPSPEWVVLPPPPPAFGVGVRILK